MQLCTLRSGGKKLLSDTLVLLIISKFIFLCECFFFVVYHDHRIRNLCKYTWSSFLNGTVCSLLSTSPRPGHNVSDYLRPFHLQFSGLYLVHPFALCLVFAACPFCDANISLLSSSRSQHPSPSPPAPLQPW